MSALCAYMNKTASSYCLAWKTLAYRPNQVEKMLVVFFKKNAQNYAELTQSISLQPDFKSKNGKTKVRLIPDLSLSTSNPRPDRGSV